MVTISIDRTPPTAQRIQLAKESLETSLRKTKIKRIATQPIIFTILISSCLIAIQETSLFNIALVVNANLLVLIVMHYSNKLDIQTSALEKTVEGMHFNTHKDFKHFGINVLSVCKENNDCEEYRSAVAQQNRPLMVCEARMLQEWPITSSQEKYLSDISDKTEKALVLLTSKEPIRTE
jgi:hypothetical protein